MRTFFSELRHEIKLYIEATRRNQYTKFITRPKFKLRSPKAGELSNLATFKNSSNNQARYH